jgi:hypothetical protein
MGEFGPVDGIVQDQATITLAQGLFAMTAFFVAPAFGLGGLMLGAPWIRPLARVLVPALAVVAGLAFTGAVGMLLYPEYPFIGPPERVASSLVLGGHLAGAIALAWLVRLRRDSDEPAPRVLWIASGVVWVGASFIALTIAFANASPLRLRLPDEATRVVERRAGELLMSDFTYILEADMSSEAYDRYAAEIGLPAVGANQHELVDDDCGTRTHYDGVRMHLESWCQ